MSRPAAIADYDANAEALAHAWSSIDPREVHAPVLHLLPSKPARILDVGAGTGRDARWLAAQGHAVLAVEPAEGLRRIGSQGLGDLCIEWLDDALPDLRGVLARGEQFDLVLLTAVWAHLHQDQRTQAMPNLARLMRPGARLILSIRQDWTPPERPVWPARPQSAWRKRRACGWSSTRKRPRCRR
jgi:SAM-dependent methyltransferase